MGSRRCSRTSSSARRFAPAEAEIESESMSRSHSSIPRRAMLKGGAIALGLPWLEALAPTQTAAAASSPARRYMSMYFPNGTTNNFWLPPAPGTGGAFSLAATMEPAMPSKANMMILRGVGNYSAFGPATGTVSPSHGTNCGGAFHCYDGRKATGSAQGGGITVDQVIANQLGSQIGSMTKLPSLQVGLSTLDS